jgi:hypothetical protein
MTQNKNIQDLLYFKAFKDKKTIKLKSNTNKEYDNNIIVIISILN